MSSPQAKSLSRLSTLPPKRGEVKRKIFKAVANAIISFGTGTKTASERKLKRTQTAGSFSSSSTYSSGCNSPRIIDDHSDWCIIAYNKLSQLCCCDFRVYCRLIFLYCLYFFNIFFFFLWFFPWIWVLQMWKIVGLKA